MITEVENVAGIAANVAAIYIRVSEDEQENGKKRIGVPVTFSTSVINRSLSSVRFVLLSYKNNFLKREGFTNVISKFIHCRKISLSFP